MYVVKEGLFAVIAGQTCGRIGANGRLVGLGDAETETASACAQTSLDPIAVGYRIQPVSGLLNLPAATTAATPPQSTLPDPPQPPEPARPIQAKVSDASSTQLSLTGSLDKSDIKEVMQKNASRFRYCYERELVKNPALAGRVMVAFTISSTGSVAAATVISSTMGNTAVESCLTGAIRRLKFPAPVAGGIVQVKWPFVFST